jgi:hypothetical protein
MSEDPGVVIYSGNIVQADLLRSLLEGIGVRSYLNDEMLGHVLPYVVEPGGAGAVKVVIAREDLHKARAIIQEFIRDRSHH